MKKKEKKARDTQAIRKAIVITILLIIVGVIIAIHDIRTEPDLYQHHGLEIINQEVRYMIIEVRYTDYKYIRAVHRDTIYLRGKQAEQLFKQLHK